MPSAILTMRYFKYNEGQDNNGIDHIAVKSEQEILDEYWDYWFDEMSRVHDDFEVSEEDCLADFVNIHWAWEVDKQEWLLHKANIAKGGIFYK